MASSVDIFQSLEQEIYFLIIKFLENGVCKDSTQKLKEECTANKLLPTRRDWTGQSHVCSFEKFKSDNNHISWDHLLKVTSSLGPLLEQYCPSNAPGLQTLLGSGLQSVLRKPEDRERCILSLSKLFATRNGHPMVLSSNHVVPSISVVNKIHYNQVTGCHLRPVNSQRFQHLNLRKRILGHGASVYCLTFDRTSTFAITAADDSLIKIWCIHTLRLVACLRGHKGEVCDLSVSHDNQLLVSGACDKRVIMWSLKKAVPLAILNGHTHPITNVSFSPFEREDACKWFASTGKDGLVCFWSYTKMADKYEFCMRPIKFIERSGPNCIVLNASFSAGGIFYAAGCSDHAIRVYCFQSLVPEKIGELEGHKGEVDSVCYCHQGDRFATGSTDGTCRIWRYERQHWKSLVLRTGSPTRSLTWNCNDRYLVTAHADLKVLIWDSSCGELLAAFKQHKDEVFVLDSHPFDPNIILSGSYDGFLVVYDLSLAQWNKEDHRIMGTPICRFENEYQANKVGSIHEAKFSPDGEKIVAVDNQGHAVFFGLCVEENALSISAPDIQFFHYDFWPLDTDSEGYPLDRQTRKAPHLMPPPYLVDIMGHPYETELQKRVPGRENLNTMHLTPCTITEDTGDLVVIDDSVAAQQIAQRGLLGPQRTFLSTSIWQQQPLTPDLDQAVYRHSVSLRFAQGNDEVRRFCTERRLKSNIAFEVESDPSRALRKRISVNNSVPQAASNQNKVVSTVVTEELGTTEAVNRLTARALYDTEPESNDEAVDIDRMYQELDDQSDYSDWLMDEEEGLVMPTRTQRKRMSRQVVLDNNSNSSDSSSSSTEEDTSAVAQPSDVSVSKRPVRKKVAKIPLSLAVSTSSAGEASITTKPKRSVAARLSSSVALDDENADLYMPPEWITTTLPRHSPYVPQMGDKIVYFKQGHMKYIQAVKNSSIYPVKDRELPWIMHPDMKPHEFATVTGLKHILNKPPRLLQLRLALFDSNEKPTSSRNFEVKYHDMDNVLDFMVLKQAFDNGIAHNWKVGDICRTIIDDQWWTAKITSIAPYDHEIPDSHWLKIGVKWDSDGSEEFLSPWDIYPLDDNEQLTKETQNITAEEFASLQYEPQKSEWPRRGRNAECDRLAKAMDKLIRMPVFDQFSSPVDLVQYPSYKFTIAYPMDLSTIRDRIKNRYYRRLLAIQYDVRFIANNAEYFNEPDSVIVKRAQFLTDFILELIRRTDIADLVALLKEYRDKLELDAETITTSDIEYTDEEEVDEIKSEEEFETASKSCLQESSVAHITISSRSVDEPSVQPHSESSQDIAVDIEDSVAESNQWIGHCLSVLKQLIRRDDSAPFREPVNLHTYPDYTDVVSHPIDISLAKSNLQQGKYKTPIEFFKDVSRIFTNSKLYNTDNTSRIYQYTLSLQKHFETLMNSVLRRWKRLQKLSHPSNSGQGDRQGDANASSRPSQAVPRESNKSDSPQPGTSSKKRTHTDAAGPGTSKSSGHKEALTLFSSSFLGPQSLASLGKRSSRRTVRYDESDESSDDQVSRRRSARYAKRPSRYSSEEEDIDEIQQPSPSNSRRRSAVSKRRVTSSEDSSQSPERRVQSTRSAGSSRQPKRPRTNNEETNRRGQRRVDYRKMFDSPKIEGSGSNSDSSSNSSPRQQSKRVFRGSNR